MNEENKILSTLPSKAREGLEDFTQGLQQTFGDGLVSVILYGSAALGEYVSGRSNLNALIVLDDENMARLRHAAKIVQEAQRKHAIEPRFMSLEEIRHSTDVLPIAFLDMQENYTVLYGQDVLGDLTISRENLRLQCEGQLRAILFRLRHRYLYSMRDRQRLQTMLGESFTKFLHILKTFYRLEGDTPPESKADIISGASERYGLDREVLASLLSLKMGTRKLRREELEALFDGYLSVVKTAAIRMDRMEVA